MNLFSVAALLAVLAAPLPAGVLNPIGTINVGSAPTGIVRTPNGAELYVSNNNGGTVSVINTATNTVTFTIPVVSSPDSITVSPDGSKVYVGSQSSGVSVIDTATKGVTTVGTGGPVRQLAITPDGSKVFLASEVGGLRQLTTATNIVSLANSFVCPEGVAVTPDGASAYVNYQCAGPGGSGGHDAVGHFNAVTNAFLGSITGLPNVGGQAYLSPNGSELWLIGGDACSSPYDHVGCPPVPGVPEGVINVIGLPGETLLASLGFSLPDGAGAVSFFPDSSLALVGGSFNLKIFSTSTLTLVDVLPFAASGNVAFSLDGGTAYATLPGQNQVEVFAVAPEPSTLILFGAPVALWIMRVRRRR